MPVFHRPRVPPLGMTLGTTCLMLALFLHVVGLVTVNWKVKNHDVHSTGYGLWSVCVCNEHATRGWLDVVRAFGIMASLTMGVSLVMTVVMLFVEASRLQAAYLAVFITSIVSVIFILIQLSVYGAESGDEGSLSVSFAGSVLSALSAVAVAVIFYLMYSEPPFADLLTRHVIVRREVSPTQE